MAPIQPNQTSQEPKFSDIGDIMSTSQPFSKSRVILLSRHGESENNLNGKIGGDAVLSKRGNAYAGALARYVNSMDFDKSNFHVWTSCYRRTVRTAAGVRSESRNKLPELDELNAGICEGLSYEEIQELYPEEFAGRDQDKLRYRYPKGESYEDVLQRLQPVIDKLQSEDGNFLIVSHQAIIRCILTHFLNKSWGFVTTLEKVLPQEDIWPQEIHGPNTCCESVTSCMHHGFNMYLAKRGSLQITSRFDPEIKRSSVYPGSIAHRDLVNKKSK